MEEQVPECTHKCRRPARLEGMPVVPFLDLLAQRGLCKPGLRLLLSPIFDKCMCNIVQETVVSYVPFYDIICVYYMCVQYVGRVCCF
jgi:hypothetical protein